MIQTFPLFYSDSPIHNELYIGLALVVERTETVPGHTLQQYEEKLQLIKLCAGPYDHPVYDYCLEEGGFCSWTREDLRPQ